MSMIDKLNIILASADRSNNSDLLTHNRIINLVHSCKDFKKDTDIIENVLLICEERFAVDIKELFDYLALGPVGNYAIKDVNAKPIAKRRDDIIKTQDKNKMALYVCEVGNYEKNVLIYIYDALDKMSNYGAKRVNKRDVITEINKNWQLSISVVLMSLMQTKEFNSFVSTGKISSDMYHDMKKLNSNDTKAEAIAQYANCKYFGDNFTMINNDKSTSLVDPNSPKADSRWQVGLDDEDIINEALTDVSRIYMYDDPIVATKKDIISVFKDLAVDLNNALRFLMTSDRDYPNGVKSGEINSAKCSKALKSNNPEEIADAIADIANYGWLIESDSYSE